MTQKMSHRDNDETFNDQLIKSKKRSPPVLPQSEGFGSEELDSNHSESNPQQSVKVSTGTSHRKIKNGNVDQSNSNRELHVSSKFGSGRDEAGDICGSDSNTRLENKACKRSESHLEAAPRLLVVSSKIKNMMLIQTALLSNVTCVQYKYESASLENILGSISQHLGRKMVESVAFLVHSSSAGIHITAKEEMIITKESLQDNSYIKNFLRGLVGDHVDVTNRSSRLDFLGCGAFPDGSYIAKEAEELLAIPVGISKDITGTDITIESETGLGSKMNIGELYFRLDRLRWNGNNQQTMAGFEKIRTVGKGAYGTAVLYRKKDDNSLVILKEINLHDLNASERQMALNEVRVLAMLDHPNIISYYDSFEEDGIIMIEMEYADGGTLAQYLASREKPLEERDILGMFSQIVSAIKCIHEHNVLHRDLKTDNIFLTKEGHVKVGDFGISKLMSTTNQGANTVLGTPYYISPEMCEGKEYNDKSDMWALGCVLYEMACLQRTFEGSNLPALVNKIMKGQFAPVKGTYSQEFKNLIMAMLQREPMYRPSAADVWTTHLPELLSRCGDEDPASEEDELMASSENTMGSSKKSRTVLYYVEMDQMKLSPIALPSRIKVKDVAVGTDHVIVVSSERMVYTWGKGSKGQLGHGNLESMKVPTLVEALKGKSIIRACCGRAFSVFGSDNGIVMTCGDGVEGCLGHGDWCSTPKPRLIESLLSVDVVCIRCGPNHVAAVGNNGQVFTWGSGADGRLGLGSEENQCQPMQVSFAEPVSVKQCRCGVDGTMLLTDVGSVLACGSNEHNKLGLNARVGFLMAMKHIFNKTEVPGVRHFTVVRALARHRVTDIAMGRHHTAVVVEPGHVFTMGKNSEGQLGNGNTKPQNAPIRVKMAEDRPVFRVQCGEYSTVAASTDNDLQIWGTRFKRPAPSDETPEIEPEMRVESAVSNSPHPSTSCLGSVSSVRDVSVPAISGGNGGLAPHQTNPETGEDGSGGGAQLLHQRQASSDSVFTSNPDLKAAPQELPAGAAGGATGGFRPIGSGSRTTRTVSGSREKEVVRERDAGRDKEEAELFLVSTPLLRMDSSGTHSRAGDTVTLSQFFFHGENLFIQVETTAPPPPRRRSRKKRSYFRCRVSSHATELPDSGNRMSASSREGGDEYSSEASEMGSNCSIPAWLRQELATSVETKDGNEPDDTSGHSDDERHLALDSSMASIQINNDLKPASSSKSTHNVKKTRSVTQGKIPAMDRVMERTRSVAIETRNAVDPLSSSSSSENMSPFSRSLEDTQAEAVARVVIPRGGVARVPPKRVPISTPPHQKLRESPTQSQKAPARTRGPIKARRPESRESTTPRCLSEAEVRGKQRNANHMQTELERLQREKRETEERLKKLEDEHKRQKERIMREAQEKAATREVELKEEIQNLRHDLRSQSHQLQDNYQVVRTLQEQLAVVQSEQTRLREVRPDSRQSVRESKICMIQ